jgi:hypothetical protein
MLNEASMIPKHLVAIYASFLFFPLKLSKDNGAHGVVRKEERKGDTWTCYKA